MLDDTVMRNYRLSENAVSQLSWMSMLALFASMHLYNGITRYNINGTQKRSSFITVFSQYGNGIISTILNWTRCETRRPKEETRNSCRIVRLVSQTAIFQSFPGFPQTLLIARIIYFVENVIRPNNSFNTLRRLHVPWIPISWQIHFHSALKNKIRNQVSDIWIRRRVDHVPRQSQCTFHRIWTSIQIDF
jgi:hypothetical protein